MLFNKLILVISILLIGVMSLQSNAGSWVSGVKTHKNKTTAHYSILAERQSKYLLTFVCSKKTTDTNKSVIQHTISLRSFATNHYKNRSLSTPIPLFYKFDEDRPGKTTLVAYKKPKHYKIKMFFSPLIIDEFREKFKHSKKLSIFIDGQIGNFDLSLAHDKLDKLRKHCDTL